MREVVACGGMNTSRALTRSTHRTPSCPASIVRAFACLLHSRGALPAACRRSPHRGRPWRTRVHSAAREQAHPILLRHLRRGKGSRDAAPVVYEVVLDSDAVSGRLAHPLAQGWGASIKAAWGGGATQALGRLEWATGNRRRGRTEARKASCSHGDRWSAGKPPGPAVGARVRSAGGVVSGPARIHRATVQDS